MKKLLSLILSIMLVLSLVPAFAAEEDDGSLQYILDKGTLVLGLDDTFAPMGFRDENGDIVGFDIDVAKLVAEKLGVELVLQPVDWDSKEMELATKNIDCIWNGLSITPARQEEMAMTAPYMNNAMALVSASADYTTIESMKGATLGIQAASYAEEMLYSEDYKDFLDSLGEVVAFAEYATAFIDLANGNLNAILVDSVYAGYTTANLEGEYFIGEALEDDLYGVAFRKDDITLCETVDAILQELKDDGTLAELSISWLGEDLIFYPGE